jgi:hypothetical protein
MRCSIWMSRQLPPATLRSGGAAGQTCGDPPSCIDTAPRLRCFEAWQARTGAGGREGLPDSRQHPPASLTHLLVGAIDADAIPDTVHYNAGLHSSRLRSMPPRPDRLPGSGYVMVPKAGSAPPKWAASARARAAAAPRCLATGLLLPSTSDCQLAAHATDTCNAPPATPLISGRAEYATAQVHAQQTPLISGRAEYATAQVHAQPTPLICACRVRTRPSTYERAQCTKSLCPTRRGPPPGMHGAGRQPTCAPQPTSAVDISDAHPVRNDNRPAGPCSQSTTPYVLPPGTRGGAHPTTLPPSTRGRHTPDNTTAKY